MDEFIGWPKPDLLLSWMINEFIDWPKPYLPLSATCDEILSWLMEIWMKNHLVR